MVYNEFLSRCKEGFKTYDYTSNSILIDVRDDGVFDSIPKDIKVAGVLSEDVLNEVRTAMELNTEGYILCIPNEVAITRDLEAGIKDILDTISGNKFKLYLVVSRAERKLSDSVMARIKVRLWG